MAREKLPVLTATTRALLALVIATTVSQFAAAQATHPVAADSANFQVSGDAEQLEMIVNTSRILTLNHKVPRLLVQNQEIIQATPLSPNQIQVSALKPGVTALNLWDENDKIQVINIRVFGDVRELEDNLKSLFPTAKLKLRALPSSLMLSGYVPNSDMVQSIVEVSEEYFPKVINRVTVGGAQQVLLHVKVFEVSRTKLQRLGIDWAYINLDDFIIQNASGLASSIAGGVVPATGTETVRFGVINNQASFSAFINTLRQNSLAKIMAEPTLVTVSGRAARFLSGGQVPVPVSTGLGAVSIEYRDFGTLVDFVPIVQGNGMIKLEVRPTITEIDPSLRDPVTGTPGFRARSVDTSVELRAGQTMALAGLIQTRSEPTCQRLSTRKRLSTDWHWNAKTACSRGTREFGATNDRAQQ